MISKGERGLQNRCRRLAVAVVPVVQVDFAKMEMAIMNVLMILALYSTGMCNHGRNNEEQL